MASGAGKIPLSLLSLLSLLLLVHAKLNLFHSDHQSLLLIKRDLGVTQTQSPNKESSPCNSAGVICERRISNNSYVLRISHIVFKSQNLTGFLSPEIGKLSELKELSVPNNQLVHQIPPEISRCRKIEILNLQNNQFSGEVTPEISSLIRLRVLDISSNKLSGNLNFLRHFPNLETLSLSNNMFSGKVPPSLRSFRNLRFFNISGNSFLEVPVPVLNRLEHSAVELTEENINIVPRRYIFSENSTVKNQTSAAGQSSGSSNAPAPAPAAATTKHKKHKKNPGRMILGFFIGLVGGTLSGFLFSVVFKLMMHLIWGEARDSGPTIFSPLIKKAEDLKFLEKEDGLASLEIIGQGGCGEVYKAELPGSNGKLLAIKKIIQSPKGAIELSEEDTKLLNKKMRQIKSEIQTVGHIRHRSLLPLLAHVPRPDCHYLVYEFMKNGSLQDILNQVSVGTRELDWLTRHNIALGVASGLEYLHMSHTPHIIHRDLKPANILLDDNMEAKIADFGLAKALPEMHTHVTTSNVAGTVGYIAPEYHQTLKFTEKCDIYSFGVVLGVLVIGKLPSDDFFQHTSEMSLVRWMRNIMTSQTPSEAIDPKLMGNGYEEQMILVLKIACFCTLEDPKQRPNSKDARCMLTQIIH